MHFTIQNRLDIPFTKVSLHILLLLCIPLGTMLMNAWVVKGEYSYLTLHDECNFWEGRQS